MSFDICNEDNELERKEARRYVLTFLELAIHKGGKASHKKHIQWQNKIKNKNQHLEKEENKCSRKKG